MRIQGNINFRGNSRIKIRQGKMAVDILLAPLEKQLPKEKKQYDRKKTL